MWSGRCSAVRTAQGAMGGCLMGPKGDRGVGGGGGHWRVRHTRRHTPPPMDRPMGDDTPPPPPGLGDATGRAQKDQAAPHPHPPTHSAHRGLGPRDLRTCRVPPGPVVCMALVSGGRRSRGRMARGMPR